NDHTHARQRTSTQETTTISPTQLKYIRFCQELNLDYSRVDPVVLLNFLAWGYTTLRWKCTTVQNYRAHVKYLYPDTSDFDDEPDFSTFFKTLQAMEKRLLWSF
ncbi:hypothetical protein BGZ91_009756, partial [Linnemannia elongata]